jgi:hypothetical protein
LLVFWFQVVGLSSPASFAQLSNEGFQDFLTGKMSFSAEEIISLSRREVVTKIIPVQDKQEIAIFGIVRLEDLPKVTPKTFRESLDQKHNVDFKSGGRLSTPPTVEDLARLNFEDRDLEDLRSCVVGNCKVKLPAAMIASFQSRVDWNASDHKSRATRLLKDFMIGYALDYLRRGDKAAIEYADKRTPVKLSEEYIGLIESNPLIAQIAPEFGDYLLTFPTAQLPETENTLDWSKIASGVKPVISLTHSASYQKRSDASAVLFIVTKQLYANHYIDASLTVAALVQFPVGEVYETYLIFDNHSRSDALAGIFGEMIRGLTEKEAQKRVGGLLERANHHISLVTRKPLDAPTVDEPNGFFLSILRFLQRPAILIAAAFIADVTFISVFARNKF